ncbi:MAG: OadG family protein [Lentisphaerae bacterium]|nr:OadG family protein [Lentisphaerota bacterium]
MQALIIKQGLVLMAAGMAIVFVFLYVMVLVMRLTAMVVPRFNHLLPDVAPKAPPRPAAAAPAPPDAAIAVAIAAAVARTR